MHLDFQEGLKATKTHSELSQNSTELSFLLFTLMIRSKKER